ncbi:CrcB family protein [Kibdelosporangium philippinense]|uniref:Fluoride-specific ion channel FluC n=1 Tax=Kibdelosporangium philippinense TaxID=211113 RepID=A0ABS8ZG46_9PSEU|nr:CrcB family protein [Kibdelosporangium philippinense]MCE7006795.1 CrcB family protein [Kibdelosporangium philippinense]
MQVVLAVSLGGGLGALARYAVSLAIPSIWGTFGVNALGCLLIGILMGLQTEPTRPGHRLTRPFLGVGVLGGFTTFSTYTVQGLELTFGPAVLYLAATLVAAMIAVTAGILIGRRFA